MDTPHEEFIAEASAEARGAEERAAWDRYAAAFLASTERRWGNAVDDAHVAAAKAADAMLVEQQKRFGGGSP